MLFYCFLFSLHLRQLILASQNPSPPKELEHVSFRILVQLLIQVILPEKQNCKVEGDPRAAYLYAFYWSLMTLTTVGYGDIAPQNHTEHLCAVVIMLIAGSPSLAGTRKAIRGREPFEPLTYGHSTSIFCIIQIITFHNILV